MSDHADWLRLTLTPGLGPTAQRALLAAFGLPEQIFAANRSAVVSIVGAEAADRLLAPPDPAQIERSLAWMAQADNHLVTLADADYPQSLLTTADPPVLLYVTGRREVLNQTAIAIVGARSSTAQGVANAEAFATHLATGGLSIVSGLALGIDAAAHRGALAAPDGTTIAVIGTGADRVYPARNRGLAHEIATHGAIISEYPLGTPPLPHNFPRRNRIIAGLGQGVLVVEAALNSGSLITARLAAENGREVFAIPGSIHSPTARGCHRLIREGAKLVETASDILEELRLTGLPTATGASPERRKPTAAKPQLALRPALPTDPDSDRVLAALGHDPADIDTLAARSGLTLDALYAILLPLELDGHISRLPGGRFQRL